MKMQVQCKICGDITIIDVTHDQMERYRSGELIQNVFPDMDAGTRELMISGLCGKCYDDLFKEE